MPEIEIRPSSATDLTTMMDFDHSFQTHYVWQMDRQMSEGQLLVNFREIRLPRPIHVQVHHSAEGEGKSWATSGTLLTALIDKQPVAYLRLKKNSLPQVAWVTDLVVHQPFRRKGIGTALLLAAQDWAVNRKLRYVTCEMQSKNYPAIKMVNKLGYEFCGYNDHYYSNQDIALFFSRYLR